MKVAVLCTKWLAIRTMSTVLYITVLERTYNCSIRRQSCYNMAANIFKDQEIGIFFYYVGCAAVSAAMF